MRGIYIWQRLKDRKCSVSFILLRQRREVSEVSEGAYGGWCFFFFFSLLHSGVRVSDVVHHNPYNKT